MIVVQSQNDLYHPLALSKKKEILAGDVKPQLFYFLQNTMFSLQSLCCHEMMNNAV